MTSRDLYQLFGLDDVSPQRRARIKAALKACGGQPTKQDLFSIVYAEVMIGLSPQLREMERLLSEIEALESRIDSLRRQTDAALNTTFVAGTVLGRRRSDSTAGLGSPGGAVPPPEAV